MTVQPFDLSALIAHERGVFAQNGFHIRVQGVELPLGVSFQPNRGFDPNSKIWAGRWYTFDCTFDEGDGDITCPEIPSISLAQCLVGEDKAIGTRAVHITLIFIGFVCHSLVRIEGAPCTTAKHTFSKLGSKYGIG